MSERVIWHGQGDGDGIENASHRITLPKETPEKPPEQLSPPDDNPPQEGEQ